MGCICSKTKGDGPETSSQVLSPVESDLSAYEAACKNDPALQHFDARLHELTNHVLGRLAAGSDVRSLSFDLLKDVIGYLLETNQNVANIVSKYQKDIWKNQDLYSLVDEFFENSKKALEFCAALENCLERAQNKHLIIQLAAKYFEEEVGLQVGTDEKKFVKTLEELRKFNAAEEPFTKEFSLLFVSVQKQQKSMLEKLHARKRKLDKKLKCLKTWRRVSNVLFVATFVSVLILSVVAAAISAPPVMTAMASAMQVPIASVGTWCNMLWKRYENELKVQEELTKPLEVGADRFILEDMKTIKVLVSQLVIKIESLSGYADFALIEEDEVKLVINQINGKLDVFMGAINQLGQQAEICRCDIKFASTLVFERLVMKRQRSGTSGNGNGPLQLGP